LKKIVGGFLIILILYNFLLILFLFTYPEYLGTFEPPFSIRSGLHYIIFLIFAGVTSLIFGGAFVRDALRSDDLTIRWKGIFIFSGFITLATGGIIESLAALNLIVFIISRLLIIYSAFAFYFGFLLPKPLENLILRNQEKK
ncbi:MAG: hypothetical protein ACFFAO_07200, partial [Candidatus Hermodarchaeota archaeon]